ncbi:tape measure protein [Acinetobacter gerneri]|uniref:tape measure protein n=1 Tax=Acinetobacter gerneri TaxID=202952 RepID=UPI0029356D7B|nr:tape measure protein [Acinetobacter gerneri]MDV2441386.1 tape measure protein [Acinetobacter gerneri]
MAESALLITIDSRQALINAQAVNKELQSIEKTGNFASKSMDSLSVATRTLAGHMAGLVTVGAAVSKMDAHTGLQNRLKLVTNSQVELNKAMSDTFAIAQKTRQSWESAAQVYQGFANNAKALGLTMSQTAQLTETVSKAVAISGGSVASSEAALIQFNQALGAGALRGEELNSVMEQTPGLAKAIAEGMGITIGQLRTVAAQGKITSEELVKALTKAKSSVDDLFSKTDITIGQSITLLNNELSKFVGEAGQSSGAAKTLAEGIQTLSQNLAPLADGAMVLGIGYLTKSMLEKAAATRSAIVASAQSQAAIIAEKTATVELAGVEALRARQNASLAAQELRTAQLALVNAKNKDAQALATQRLAVAEVAYAASVKESTIATAQYTLAQDALNRSKSLGSKLLALVGGPIGALTLAAMGLGAGYMYMQKRADEANKKLEEQTDVANKTKEELLALQGVQKKGAISDLEDSFKGQNEALKKLNYQFNSHVIALQNDYKSSVEIADISNDVRKGIISQEEAIKRLNKLNFIDPEQLKQLEKDNELYREKLPIVQKVQEALKVFGVDAELAGNKATNASHGINDIAKEAITTSSKVKDLSADIQKFINDSLSNISTDSEVLKLRAQGISKEYAEAYVKLKASQGLLGKDQPVDMGAFTILIKEMNLKQQIQNLDEKDRKAEQEKTKELEKQQKIREKTIKSMTVDSVIARGEGGYNSFNRGKAGDSIGSKLNLVDMTVGQIRTLQKNGSIFAAGKYQTIPKTLQGAIDAGIVSSAEKFTAEVQERIVQQYLLTAKKGRGSIEDYITGKSDNLTAANLDLAKEFASVASPLTGKSYYDGDKASNKSSISVKDAQNALKASRELYAQAIASGKSAQEAWKAAFNGSISFVDGSQTQKDLDKFVQEALKTQQEIDQLRAKYDSDAITRNKARIKEISDAEKLGQLDLIPKIKARYDAQGKLAELQIDSDLNGWKWNENQKLVYTYQTNKLRLDAEGKLGEDIRDLAKKNLDEQMFYETQKRLQASSLGIGQIALDAQSYLRQKQNPLGFQQDQLDSETINKYRELQLKYSSQRGDIFDLVGEENARNEQLLDAHRQFLEAKKALDDEYVAKQQDLAISFQNEQFGMYNQLLSQAGSVWGSMTQMVKDSAGESSAAYKALFLVNQGIAMGQAIINTEVAATKAMADGGYIMGIPMSTAIRAMGYASVGLIAAQTIQGMAHNGIDNIPKEGTWLLDGGERVLNPKQNQDLTNYLSSRREQQQHDLITQAKATVVSKPNITINNFSNEKVETSTSPNGDLLIQIGKMIDQKVENGVDKGIQKSLRQGGDIDREFRKRR